MSPQGRYKIRIERQRNPILYILLISDDEKGDEMGDVMTFETGWFIGSRATFEAYCLIGNGGDLFSQLEEADIRMTWLEED